jgi:ribosomal protein S14
MCPPTFISHSSCMSITILQVWIFCWGKQVFLLNYQWIMQQSLDFCRHVTSVYTKFDFCRHVTSVYTKFDFCRHVTSVYTKFDFCRHVTSVYTKLDFCRHVTSVYTKFA